MSLHVEKKYLEKMFSLLTLLMSKGIPCQKKRLFHKEIFTFGLIFTKKAMCAAKEN